MCADMVHRDIKLENILVTQNPANSSDNLFIKVRCESIKPGSSQLLWCKFVNTTVVHVQVTDFGLSIVKSGVGQNNMLMDSCGTPLYMGS